LFKRLIAILSVFLVLAVALVGADLYRFFEQPLANAKPELIEIPPGTSFTQLTNRLKAQGVVRRTRDMRYLTLYARLTGQATRIKSGEYLVPPAQKPTTLLHQLVSGDIRQRRLTLVEGWRFSDILAAIASSPAIDHQLTGDSPAEIMKALGHPGEDPEGRFMPDTYMFPRGTSDIAFLKRAYNTMQTFLAQAWAERADDTVVDTPYEALTLASIIEKETARGDERERIAGVYSRRLTQGMRLQSDPSVIYGIADYDGNIHRSDLRRDTPYNTYTRKGLPPTPIAMPSRASIKAALHPADGDALYFVARGDGSHVFSATLAAHNRAVQKYQLGGS
tara:strand:+ start:696 stop:1700 length:1005 start_codon:yes stop_codon:yes gene_type:complete